MFFAETPPCHRLEVTLPTLESPSLAYWVRVCFFRCRRLLTHDDCSLRLVVWEENSTTARGFEILGALMKLGSSESKLGFHDFGCVMVMSQNLGRYKTHKTFTCMYSNDNST
jgi:hypothetical protein